RDKTNSLNSADQGFNEFLRSLAGLEALKTGSKEFLEVSDYIPSSKLLKFLSLEKIENYFSALEHLYSNKDDFKLIYEYSGWTENCFEFIDDLLFQSETNWFINPQDDLRARERRRMVFLWSILEFLCIKKQNGEKWNMQEIFRIIRIYWIR